MTRPHATLTPAHQSQVEAGSESVDAKNPSNSDKDVNQHEFSGKSNLTNVDEIPDDADINQRHTNHFDITQKHTHTEK